MFDDVLTGILITLGGMLGLVALLAGFVVVVRLLAPRLLEGGDDEEE